MSIGQAAKEVLADRGHSLQVVEVTQTGTDGYGDPIYDEATTDVMGRVVRDNDSNETVQAGGSSVMVDADIFVAADIGPDLKTVESEEPTEINVQGTTFKILSKDDQKNGITRLRCKRE